MALTSSTQPAAASRPAVVVTGASSGIGKELARLAATDADALLLVARSSDSLQTLADELTPVCANTAWLAIDLASPEPSNRISENLRERGWYCDVLVYAAGLGHVGPAWQAERDDQLRVIDVNARAFTDLTLKFLPDMVERRGRGVLVIGSMAGFFPGPNMAVYYATKAYVRSLAAALSAETRGTGVTVTCVSPGFVDTPFLAESGLLPTRLRKILPRITATHAARIAWQAFRSRKDHVVPGLANKLIVGLIRMTPINILARLIQRLQR